jgi:hypothetical protein
MAVDLSSPSAERGRDVVGLAALAQPLADPVQARLGTPGDLRRTWSGWPAWRLVSVTPIRGSRA